MQMVSLDSAEREVRPALRERPQEAKSFLSRKTQQVVIDGLPVAVAGLHPSRSYVAVQRTVASRITVLLCQVLEDIEHAELF
jgi:hypothetical protein